MVTVHSLECEVYGADHPIDSYPYDTLSSPSFLTCPTVTTPSLRRHSGFGCLVRQSSSGTGKQHLTSSFIFIMAAISLEAMQLMMQQMEASLVLVRL